MLKEIFMAGFGGQGIMSMGELLAYGGMLEGKAVSWIPSYGAEVRGGTANCAVCISDEAISSPVVTEPDVLIVMNRPSLEKYEGTLKPGGLLLINSSLIDIESQRQDVDVCRIPVNEVADKLGNSHVANIVMLGALLAKVPVVKSQSLMDSLKKVLSENKHHLLPVNAAALETGKKLGRE